MASISLKCHFLRETTWTTYLILNTGTSLSGHSWSPSPHSILFHSNCHLQTLHFQFAYYICEPAAPTRMKSSPGQGFLYIHGSQHLRLKQVCWINKQNHKALSRASQVVQRERICLPSQEMQEMQIQSLDWEDPLEEEMATHSSFLPGKFHGQRTHTKYWVLCLDHSKCVEALIVFITIDWLEACIQGPNVKQTCNRF